MIEDPKDLLGMKPIYSRVPTTPPNPPTHSARPLTKIEEGKYLRQEHLEELISQVVLFEGIKFSIALE
ncbi:MAG: hypothetical protein ACJAU0_000762 [Flavobacteriales bacterium]